MAGGEMDMTGVILSGGKNSRFGSNKAMAEVNGERIIDGITAKFKEIFGRVIIITNSPDEYRYLGLPLYSDIYPGMGSLGGLYTGLYRAVSDKIFVTACDMPFIDPAVIRLVLEESREFDVAVPRVGEHYEPLFAVYGKACLAPMEDMISRKKNKIIDLYRVVRVNEIDEKKIREADPGLRSFININYPGDITKFL